MRPIVSAFFSIILAAILAFLLASANFDGRAIAQPQEPGLPQPGTLQPTQSKPQSRESSSWFR